MGRGGQEPQVRVCGGVDGAERDKRDSASGGARRAGDARAALLGLLLHGEGSDVSAEAAASIVVVGVVAVLFLAAVFYGSGSGARDEH